MRVTTHVTCAVDGCLAVPMPGTRLDSGSSCGAPPRSASGPTTPPLRANCRRGPRRPMGSHTRSSVTSSRRSHSSRREERHRAASCFCDIVRDPRRCDPIGVAARRPRISDRATRTNSAMLASRGPRARLGHLAADRIRRCAAAWPGRSTSDCRATRCLLVPLLVVWIALLILAALATHASRRCRAACRSRSASTAKRCAKSICCRRRTRCST